MRSSADRPRGSGAPSGTSLFLAACALAVAVALGGCESVPFADLGPALEDDAPLSERVREALRANSEVGLFPIRVKLIDEDTVRLSGRVDNDAQRHTAETVAGRVDGVRSVVNTIYIHD